MTEARRVVSLGFTAEGFDEGNHIIYVYTDDCERKRTMARFLGQGMQDAEKVLYLVNDISPAEMRDELNELGVDADAANRAFDLMQAHYTLCPDQCFAPEFMLELVGRYYDQAIAEGYQGARGAGEMSWALEAGRTTMDDLLAYETRLNAILATHPLTTVCQYDARRFSGAIIMDLLATHPMAIVRGQLVKNPFFVAHTGRPALA